MGLLDVPASSPNVGKKRKKNLPIKKSEVDQPVDHSMVHALSTVAFSLAPPSL